MTVALIVFATDGTVRSHPRYQAGSFLSHVAYVGLPALAVLGAGLFVHEAIDGYARVASGIVAGVLVAIVVFGEYQTVDFGTPLYGVLRLILAVATYLVAFTLYTIVFVRDVELALSALIVGLVSLILAIELLRESRMIGISSLLVGFAIGVTMAELRIALYFFPLDGLLAGALLIIGFYLATGIVHHLLDHDLELATLAEYLIVGSVGTAAVVVTRVFA